MQATCTVARVLAERWPAGHNDEVASSSRLPVPFWRRVGWRFRRRPGEMARRGPHMVVCVGSDDDWVARSEGEWHSWADSLARVAAEEGVTGLTIFPVSGRGTVPPRVPPRQWTSHGVTIRALCEPDGRLRLAETVNTWPTGQALTEETLGRALTGSSGDPDVVAVVGDRGHLPNALIWELAYAEIVDIDRSWSDFTADDLRITMTEFRTRHRRFGGLGDESPGGDGVGE